MHEIISKWLLTRNKASISMTSYFLFIFLKFLLQTLRVDFYFRNWWKDQRLNFGETEFNFNGDPSDLIWVPDTFGQNAIQTTQHKTLTVNTRTKLGPNGSVYSSARYARQSTFYIGYVLQSLYNLVSFARVENIQVHHQRVTVSIHIIIEA